MTRTDLEEEVGRLLGDPSHTRWPTAIIDLRLDAAQNDVQKYARAIKVSASYTPVANTAEVTINANLIDIANATWTLPDGTIRNESYGFKPTSLWKLNFERPNWQNESAGTPLFWFLDASNQRVILVPKPDSTAAIANALTLIEIRQPALLSTASATTVPMDANVLFVPFHRALVYWAVAECYKDNNDTESLSKSKYFRSDNRQEPGLYETELKQIMALFDVPEVIPANVRYMPQGGRISGAGLSAKSDPLGWGWNH